MPGFLPYLLVALLYAGLGWHFRRSFMPGKTPQSGTTAGGARMAAFAPLVLHGWLLFQALFADGALTLGFGNAILAIAWLTVLVYWLASFHYPLDGLQMLVLPVAAGCLLVAGLLPEAPPLSHTGFTAFKAHLLISLLAYSLFTIAALHALLMALTEHRLHDRMLSKMLRNLPPLLTMETLLFRITWAGFVLLTLAILSGVMFSEELFGKAMQFSHKTLFALLSWGVYAVLLGGRHFYGWRGRTAITWSLAGFAMLLLGYLGSKFVVEIILHRGG
ncbi:MAG: cytochrome c biogenesis protein CcsA [Sulfuricella sp.]|nr:cytochrome c biogenesis protein CcsA [Sulfuricella sp.]